MGTIKVEYALLTSDEESKFVPEQKIVANFESYAKSLDPRKGDVHLGELKISDGEQEFRLCDEMWHIALYLCLSPITQLLNGETVRYSLMQTGQIVVLEPQKDHIAITGYDNQHSIFPKKALLKELYLCGGRYLDLLAELLPDVVHDKNDPVYGAPREIAWEALILHNIISSSPEDKT